MHALRSVVIAAAVALNPACGPRPCKETTTVAKPAASPQEDTEADTEAGADPIVIVVSVDGLMPETYMNPDAHGLKVPTLRALKDRGAYSPAAESVFPTVTYPAHTSIATGVNPGVHGITSNRSWDPLNRNQGGWYWYAEDIKAPTLWQAARAAGLRTALVNWPVTVGANVDFLVAEYWRAGTADDAKLAKALSTPGLLDAVAERNPGFRENYIPPDLPDSTSIDIAIHILETGKPQLMMIHIWMVDEYQHRNGPWSAEARAMIEEADAQIGRLIQALERLGMWQRTTLVVVSDHGFLAYEKVVKPGAIVAKLGLVTRGKGETLDDWKAVVRTDGGMAYLYVKDAGDAATRKALESEFGRLAAQPGSGIGRVYTGDEIKRRGGDARAFLALEAAPGFGFKDGYSGDVIAPASSKGTHGYDPQRPELKASLLIHGPGVTPGPIDGARLIDVAPTAAKRLGLTLPEAQGRALELGR